MHHLVRRSLERLRRAVAAGTSEFVPVEPGDRANLEAAAEGRDLPPQLTAKEAARVRRQWTVYVKRTVAEDLIAAVEARQAALDAEAAAPRKEAPPDGD